MKMRRTGLVGVDDRSSSLRIIEGKVGRDEGKRKGDGGDERGLHCVIGE